MACCDPIEIKTNCVNTCNQLVNSCCVINEDELPCIISPVTITDVGLVIGSTSITDSDISTMLPNPFYGVIAVSDSSGRIDTDTTVVRITNNTVTISNPILSTGRSDVTFTFTEQRQCDINAAIDSEICNLSEIVADATACLYDSTGGCEIDNLKLSITTIEGDITVIEGGITIIENDITVIEGDIVNLGIDISTLQSCVLDASGNCFADEAWKTFDASGTMLNGEDIPTLSVDATATLAGRLRHKTANHTEVQFIGTVSVADTIQIRSLFVLPTLGTGPAYRPTTVVEYPACGLLNDGSGPWIGYVGVNNTTGSVYVNVVDPIFVSDTIINLSFCILIPTD
jgi:hypothetical protein